MVVIPGVDYRFIGKVDGGTVREVWRAAGEASAENST